MELDRNRIATGSSLTRSTGCYRVWAGRVEAEASGSTRPVLTQDEFFVEMVAAFRANHLSNSGCCSKSLLGDCEKR